MIVLIVEDDTGITELIKAELRKQGHTPISVNLAINAIEYLKAEFPDMMILDFVLPDMTGLEFIDTLNKKKIKIPPFIVSTGQGTERVAVQMMKLGAKDYIVKDVNFLDLLPELIKVAAHDIDNEKKRMQAEEALRKSEAKYKMLFTNMKNGFALHKMITNKSGKPVDYYITEINPAYEQLTGLKKDTVLNKRLKEIMPDIEDELIEYFGKISMTGVSSTIEYYNKALNKYFSISLFSPEKGYFASLFDDITERKLDHTKIQKSLIEKETLLKELYHRTKNNMQVITSMLSLQKSFVKTQETKEILDNAANRIESMALVHKKLYQSQDLSNVALDEYVADLVKLLPRSYKTDMSHLDIKINVAHIKVLIDVAIPIGLLIHELFSNCIKHAFPDNKGLISISISSFEKTISIKVEDNGIGLPPDLDIENSNTLGFTIVNSLVGQLGASISCSINNGTCFLIKFKNIYYYERV